MLDIVLIGLSLVLAGLAGLQFTYLFYVERVNKERKAHSRKLERKCASLQARLDAAEQRLVEQDELLESAYPGIRRVDETWADVIDER